MQRRSVEAILRKLNEHNVRYLIVGGVAVVAHGYVRMTVDLDLVLAFDEGNLRSGVTALKELGYVPRIPVPFDEFVDPVKRKEWIEQKHMQVFQVLSLQHEKTPVDLFVKFPFDFDDAFSQGQQFALTADVSGTVCSLQTLLELKRIANRGKDQLDIEKLLAIHPNEEFR